MIWKRNLESIAQKLPSYPAPWTVKTTQQNQRVILDANQKVILSLEANQENQRSLENEVDLVWIEEFNILTLICALRNNCETWFEELMVAGVSDIVLPKKKKQQEKPVKVYVSPEPVKFTVGDYHHERPIDENATRDY